MGKRGKSFILVLIVVAAAVFVFVRSDDVSGPMYSPFSTAEAGTRLFYDTLRHMGYPVQIGYAPLTRASDTRHVYIIIQPFNPAVSQEMAEEMLDWVRRGGRLIFLQNSRPTVIDRYLAGTRNLTAGDFLHYTPGLGQVVTGRAELMTNVNLVENAAPGIRLHEFLSDWGAERIVFPVYYHGVRPRETMFSRLPLIVRLVTIQLGIATVVLLWHVGKRFGKPVPAYEETEREENEQIRALARLYHKTLGG
ncbi:MAG: DUF4350 domain-containing protein [Defluviitaleaceae bacterium]|nr:DUF4350 domain-containing protein [Defluviitaleaceae bacterium]MCL2239791.1 DUF4350 domain-containing protein [Defluviitaleaceae bacterium]